VGFLHQFTDFFVPKEDKSPAGPGSGRRARRQIASNAHRRSQACGKFRIGTLDLIRARVFLNMPGAIATPFAASTYQHDRHEGRRADRVPRNLWDGLVLSLCYIAGCAIATPDLRIEPLRALVTRGPAIVLMRVARMGLDSR
jgi:hypothetical protein